MIDKVKSALEGQPLLYIGRATDMLWMGFGKLVKIKNYKGLEDEKGEFAVHVQCPWRFVHQEKVVVGSRDIYMPRNGISDHEFDYEKRGLSIFDSICEAFNSEWIPLLVSEVCVDIFGTLKIIFANGLVFETFINSVTTDEYWRFINFQTKEHIVVFDNEQEN